MRRFELTYSSINSENYSKPTTMIVLAPDTIGANTGAMLFTHGWGGNRFQNLDKMEYTVDAFDLVCISVEFRMSGYDFDPVGGLGAYVPYDGSFMQVFDVLNGLRFALSNLPDINRKRLFHYGGSQGGCIALLASIYAPNTFAFVYSSCGITQFDETRIEWCGRQFADCEISVRSVIDHAEMIQCPVFLDHGTADAIVPHQHTLRLEEKLKLLDRKVTARYYEGGEHSLEPTTTRLEAFKAMATEPMRTLTIEAEDDFAAGRIVEIDCGSRILAIDWSKPTDSLELFSWK